MPKSSHSGKFSTYYSQHGDSEPLWKDWPWWKKGLLYTGFLEADPNQKRDTWVVVISKAIAAGVIWSVVGYAALQFTVEDYSSFWPPNGIYVGFMLASSPRLRRVHLVTMAIAIFVLNIIWGWDWQTCLAFTIVNTIESNAVALVALFIASWLTQPGAFDLTHKRHMVAFGIGVLMCGITANMGGEMTRMYINKERSYGGAYAKWLGRNFVGISLVAPLVVSLADVNFNEVYDGIRNKPGRAMKSTVAFILVGAFPALSTFLLEKTVLSAIAGLYVCYPLVMYVSALLGVFGAASSCLIIGLSVATSALLFARTHRGESYPAALPLAQQLVWIQLFLSVLIFTALAFVTVLMELDRAYQDIEVQVKHRTMELTEALESLDAAKESAESANHDKAIFLSFLCHELRNPLHAVTNMAEFLLEDLDAANASAEESSPSRKATTNGASGRDTRSRQPSADMAAATLLAAAPDPAINPSILATITPHTRAPRSPKAPVGAILQRTQSTLTAASDKSSFNRSARAIKLSSEYMLALVNDVLDLGRFEAGRVNLENLPIDLWDLLSVNFSCSTELVRGHSVTFRGAIGDDVPKWVETDPVRLQQVLNNLVSNAYKFTPEGGEVGVEVKTLGSWRCQKELEFGGCRFEGRETNKEDCKLSTLGRGTTGGGRVKDPGYEIEDVIISVDDEAGTSVSSDLLKGKGLGKVRWVVDEGFEGVMPLRRFPPPPPPTSTSVGLTSSATDEDTATWHLIEVSVFDTGIGMTPEVVSTLFRPYAQAAVSTMREYGGSGLGLAITDKIVRLMGGAIGVETEVGKGSRFSIVIPLRGVDGHEGKGRDWRSSKRRGWKKRGSEPGTLERTVQERFKEKEPTKTNGSAEKKIKPSRSDDGQRLSIHGPSSSNVNAREDTAPSIGLSESVEFVSGVVKERRSSALSGRSRETGARSFALEMTSIGTPATGNSTMPVSTLSIPASTIPPAVVDGPLASSMRPLLASSQLHSSDKHATSPIPTPQSETLPLLRIPETECEPEIDHGRLPESPASSRSLDYETKYLLIVDDSTINRRILARMLQKMLGCEVIGLNGTGGEVPNRSEWYGGTRYIVEQAENGQMAVDMVQHGRGEKGDGGVKDKYAMIFMDIVMPVMDGHQATRTIRSLQCHAPIIITTANQVRGNAEAEQQLRDVGADEAVGKPFTKEIIWSVLERWGVV
ncbi:hypothetical protein HDU85_004107 [Gaertneriomyces sp. JEL0708]|nr:hypothetical protein HDU85_004107 [Gaertneriomyces sp. JEL0708]